MNIQSHHYGNVTISRFVLFFLFLTIAFTGQGATKYYLIYNDGGSTWGYDTSRQFELQEDNTYKYKWDGMMPEGKYSIFAETGYFHPATNKDTNFEAGTDVEMKYKKSGFPDPYLLVNQPLNDVIISIKVTSTSKSSTPPATITIKLESEEGLPQKMPEEISIHAANNLFELSSSDIIYYIKDNGVEGTIPSSSVLEKTVLVGSNKMFYQSGVLSESKFLFSAVCEPEDEMEEKMTYYYGPGQDNFPMQPNLKYSLSKSAKAEDVGYFSIGSEEDALQNEGYKVIFDSINSTAFAESQESEPQFIITTESGERAEKDYFLINAIANDKDAGEGLGWKPDGYEVPIEQTPNMLFVSHSSNFGGNESNINEDHYDGTEVSIEPTYSYSRYFAEGNGNIHPAVVAPLQFYSSNTSGSSNISKFDIKAYTAGEYLINIESPMIQDSTGNILFKSSEKTFKLRVLPTVQSVGLAINGKLILPEIENSSINPNSSQLAIVIQSDDDPEKEEDVYTTMGTNPKGESTTLVWSTMQGVCMETYMADASNVEIYWKFADLSEQEEQEYSKRRSVVALENSTLSDNNENTLLDGMTKYSRNNSINDSAIENHKGNNKYARALFQVAQNGLLSSPQEVRIYNKPNENVPTGLKYVESMEAEEEMAEQYYDLRGVRVNPNNLAHGIYISVKGRSSKKIIVR